MNHALDRHRTTRRAALLWYVFIFFCCSPLSAAHTTTSPSSSHTDTRQHPVIRNIIIAGNKHLKTTAMLGALPYKQKLPFDASKSVQAINNLYQLGYFKQVVLETETIDDKTIDLYITVEEKKLVDTVTFEGNTAIKTPTLKDKLKISSRETIDEEDLEFLKKKITQLYRDKGYHYTDIIGRITPHSTSPDKVNVHITITEGPRSWVTRVEFVGNKHLPSRKLRDSIPTREVWLLSALDESGKYSPEMVEQDKRFLQRLYQDHGFIMARVTDVNVAFSESKRQIDITYHISEGSRYTVQSVSVPGDEVFLEDNLLPQLPIKAGEPYSYSNVYTSISKLKDLWGEKGYINAEVNPEIIPNDETEMVDITFLVAHGKKFRVTRIEISGNETTNDKVIRREITFEEGEYITTKQLNESRTNLERLGIFERGGVDWKIHRSNDEEGEVEIIVKEAKTGNAGIDISLGSSENSSKRAIKFNGHISKRNFLGEGFNIGANTQVQAAKNGSLSFEGFVEDPYLFDRNISGRFQGYYKKEEFDSWPNLLNIGKFSNVPNVQISGGSSRFGFKIPQIDDHTDYVVEVGMENIKTKPLKARGSTPEEAANLQTIVNRSFRSSAMQWFSLGIVRDTRNHPIYPNNGSRLALINKIAAPGINKHYAFYALELEGSYYTPVIGEDDLVLMLHGKFGSVHQLGSDRDIPYRELYHIGGQSTIRGFRFGQIGPAWKNLDPLGAQRALYFNVELIFPIVPMYQMKGHVFYDAGAGWHTPTYGITNTSPITRDKFNFRQAVGFGINLVQPQPMKIDWGYKLDRNKAAGESPHEWHFSMNIAF